MSRFQGDPAQKGCDVSGVFCIGLIESKVFYNFWKKCRGCAFRFWSYSNELSPHETNFNQQLYFKSSL